MKSIKLKNDYYLDSNGIMHNKKLISEIIDSILDYIDNWIIFKKYTKSVTIGANSFTNVNMGSIVKIDGYTAVGVLTTENLEALKSRIESITGVIQNDLDQTLITAVKDVDGLP